MAELSPGASRARAARCRRGVRARGKRGHAIRFLDGTEAWTWVLPGDVRDLSSVGELLVVGGRVLLGWLGWAVTVRRRVDPATGATAAGAVAAGLLQTAQGPIFVGSASSAGDAHPRELLDERLERRHRGRRRDPGDRATRHRVDRRVEHRHAGRVPHRQQSPAGRRRRCHAGRRGPPVHRTPICRSPSPSTTGDTNEPTGRSRDRYGRHDLLRERGPRRGPSAVRRAACTPTNGASRTASVPRNSWAAHAHKRGISTASPSRTCPTAGRHGALRQGRRAPAPPTTTSSSPSACPQDRHPRTQVALGTLVSRRSRLRSSDV